MKVIIQLQYALTDSRLFHDVKNITQSNLHPTHQKLKKLWPNSTQPMDGPNPRPTLVGPGNVWRPRTAEVGEACWLDAYDVRQRWLADAIWSSESL